MGHPRRGLREEYSCLATHGDARLRWVEPVKIDDVGYLIIVSEAVTGCHGAGVLTDARGDEG